MPDHYITNEDKNHLVVIATQGHFLPGYLDSNGELYGIAMMFKGKGYVPFGNKNKEGDIKTEMIVYDAKKFVLAESLYSDYDVSQISKEAEIFNNRKTTMGKPVEKGRLLGDGASYGNDPSQGSESKFKRNSIFGWGTADVPAGRLPLGNADTIDPSVYNSPSAASSISGGEGGTSGGGGGVLKPLEPIGGDGVSTGTLEGNQLPSGLQQAVDKCNQWYGNKPGMPPGFVYTGSKSIRAKGQTKTTLVLYWQNYDIKQVISGVGQNVLAKFDYYEIDPANAKHDFIFIKSNCDLNEKRSQRQLDTDFKYESITKDQARLELDYEQSKEQFKNALKAKYKEYGRTQGSVDGLDYVGYKEYGDGFEVYYKYVGDGANMLESMFFKEDLYLGKGRNPVYKGSNFEFYTSVPLTSKQKPYFLK